MSAVEEEEEEGAVLGPTQAPTKAGVSTIGLSESDAAFIEACYSSDVEKIEKMLDEGVDPNTADVNGRTALHFCAGNGIPTICRKLLDSGAELNKQDLLGYTPIHMATGYKKVETVKFLVQVGADANVTSFQGKLPVETAEQLLEKTPEKRFFVKNGEHGKLKEIVEILDAATEEEEGEEEDEEEVGSVDAYAEGTEVTEETESAKFTVRVKPKGESVQPQVPADVDNVKVTIRIREPESKK